MKLKSSSSSSMGSKTYPDLLTESGVDADVMERSGVLVSASESMKYEGGGLNVNLMPPSSTSPTNSSSWS